MRISSRARLALGLSLILAGAVALTGSAGANETPTPRTKAATVSRLLTAQPLPTWQTNGTVWALENVNGVVYVGGNFTAVRPPGAKPGEREVARRNMAAFDAKTGALLPFSHTFAAPTYTFDPDFMTPDRSCKVDWDAETYTCDTVYEIKKSPDGSRIYVGGDFQSVDGKSRARLAAFDTANATTANNAFRAEWNPSAPNYRVRALAVSDTTLYAGGAFTTVGGQTRNRLAAFNRLGGGGLMSWSPGADQVVLALTMAPDRKSVVVGGNFDTIAGQQIHGMATVDGANGRIGRWDNDEIVPDVSQITDLVVDSDTVYASAEGHEPGDFDGRLAVDPTTGNLRWVANCAGATWALALISNVLYSGSHAHNCTYVDGGFPEQTPRYYRLLGESARTGEPSIQHWFPSTNGGDMSIPAEETISRLGPRALTATNDYLWVGGQFTTVNNGGQQGLTRFGFKPEPTMKPAQPLKPTVKTHANDSRIASGSVVVSFPATEDLDSERLTYQVYRGNTAVYRPTISSKPWNKPMMSFTDTGLTPGSTVSYRVVAIDAEGNTSTASPWGQAVVR